MKRWILISLLTALSAALLIPMARPQSTDNDGCSDATLRGDYAFSISGKIFTPTGIVYNDGVAMTHFDGAGGLTQVDFVLVNGALAPAPTDSVTGFRIDETGSYTVNSDCTGNATINFPTPPGGTSGVVIKLMFVIADAGRTLHTAVSRLTPPNTTTPVPANIHSDAERLSPTATFVPGQD